MSTKTSVHVFSDKVMDGVVNFQVIKMTDSFHLWIGSSAKFGDMAVSMQNKFVRLRCSLLSQADSSVHK